MSDKKVIDFKVGDTVCCNCGECAKTPVVIKSIWASTIGIVAVFSDPGIFPIKYMPIEQLELVSLSATMSSDEIRGRVWGLKFALNLAPLTIDVVEKLMNEIQVLKKMLEASDDKVKETEMPTPGDVLHDSFDEFLDEVSGVFLNLLKKAMKNDRAE